MGEMLPELVSSLAALVFIAVVFPAVGCQAASKTNDRPRIDGSAGIPNGGLKSVLKDAISPAFGATIIIIITVIVSCSAYVCFLKYVCAGCCKPMQVAPVLDVEPNKVEEQV